MKNEELISVIVPIYKVEQYLEKCIDSIINQTYKNLEIILVDDGSPDNCGKICDEYSKEDNRIKVIHKKNGGLSDSRNKGLNISSGNYVVFIDSDDYIDTNMIEKLYNKLIETNSDICICDFIREFENFSKYNNFEKKYFCVEGNEKFKCLYNQYNVVSTVQWNKLYKKNIFDSIKFEVGKINEDEFIVFDEFEKANKIIYVLEPLYYYRQRQNSIMNSKFNIKRYDAIEALEKRIEKLKEKGLYELLTLNYIKIFNNILSITSMSIDSELSKSDKLVLKNYNEKMKKYAKILLKEKISFTIKIKILIYFIFPKLLLKIVKYRSI